MIDIDKIFNIEKDTTKKNINKNISLTNPILYIFIGEHESDILNNIYNFNEEKELNTTGAIEYINISTKTHDLFNNIILNKNESEDFLEKRKSISENFDKDDDIIKVISNIELKFLERSYIIPIRRRIHFVVESYNEYSCLLDKIISIIQKFFLNRNLIAIIDIFVIIDDKPDNTEIQRAYTYILLEELKSIEKDINMIYIMSNLNSSRKISKLEEIYTSIARTAIIKEFDYKKQPYDFSYNEGKIIDNVKNISEGKGNFYSLGLKVIERPKSAVQFIALKTMIHNENFIKTNIIDENVTNIVKKLSQTISNVYKNALSDTNFMELENISGIMINIKASYYNCDTNIELIKDFFCENIDKYFEYNSEYYLHSYEQEASNYIKECFKNHISNSSIGYFTAVEILKKLKIEIKEIKQTLLNSIYEQQINLDNWKDKQFIYTKKLFEDKYKFAFDIANQYIMCLYKIFIPKTALKVYTSFENTLEKLINDSELLNKEFINSKQKLIEMTELILSNIEGELITTNFIDYYSNKIKKYIEENYKDYFENVYSKIFDLSREDINIFYSECVKYINNFILNSEKFNLNVYEEILQRLLNYNSEYNEQLVNDLFNREITDNKFYFVKLINERNFYSNICVLTDNNSIIKKISNSDINYIVYSGDSKLEIIYFIGAFKEDNLIFYNLYKEAYLKSTT